MDILQHAAVGAVVTGGGVTAAQIVLSRRLRPPSSLARALGSFVGVFRFLERTGHQRSSQNGKRSPDASQAAATAAVVALVLLEAERKMIVVSYAVVEAALSLIQEFTAIADTRFIDLPLGALAAGPLIDSWIYESDTIAKSQLAALDSLCQLPSSVLRRMRVEFPTGKLISRCDVFHRGQTCTQFHTDYFIKGMKFAIRLYVPIYVASVLAPKYKQWIWGPRPALAPLVVRYFRTCCCLTMLYQAPLGFSCLSPSDRHRATVRIAGALTTLAFLAEHEHRRSSVVKAVGIYTTGTVAARVVGALGLPPRAVRLGQIMLFAAAMAVIFRRTSPDSSRLTRMLYGRSDKPTATDDEQGDGAAVS